MMLKIQYEHYVHCKIIIMLYREKSYMYKLDLSRAEAEGWSGVGH